MGDTPRSLLGRLLGVSLTPESRAERVREMIDESGGYWFQLLVAMGIATLGLVLGSATVVIGAMLVSPLMTPLVEIGMGLAVGSAALLVRAAWRTVASVACVIAGAALLTTLLPYHELTSEIAARTSPTALDLFVAGLCALMAGYNAVRPPSGATATAAGAAIGIALVPPLCVVGWGIGTRDWTVSRGAALLFTANISAILLLTLVMFLALGFASVDAAVVEQSTKARSPVGAQFTSALRRALGSRFGGVLRVAFPLAFAAAVYVPLSRALAEVAWQVRVRAAVVGIVDAALPKANEVRSSVVVENHAVSVRVLIVGEPKKARALAETLRARIAPIAGVAPVVEVTAVPDESALAAMAPQPTPVAPPKPTAPNLDQARGIVADTLANRWPTDATGPIAAWDLAVRADATGLHVDHFGAPLGAGGLALLGDTLGDELRTHVVVDERALSDAPVPIDPAHLATTWAPFQDLVAAARSIDALHVCVTRAPGPPELDRVGAMVTSALAPIPPERVSIQPGSAWTARLSLDGCETPDAGEPDAEPDADSDAQANRPLPRDTENRPGPSSPAATAPKK